MFGRGQAPFEVDTPAATLIGLERLRFLQHLLRNQSIETDDPKATGVFIYDILPGVLQERRTLAERVAKAGSVASPDDPAALLDRASVFRDPGLDHDRVGIESLMSPGSSRRDQLLAEHAR